MIIKTLKIGLLFIAICFCISCSESANEKEIIEPLPSHQLVGSWKCSQKSFTGTIVSWIIFTFTEDGKYESFSYNTQWVGDPVYGDGYTNYGSYFFNENSKLLNIEFVDFITGENKTDVWKIDIKTDSSGTYFYYGNIDPDNPSHPPNAHMFKCIKQ